MAAADELQRCLAGYRRLTLVLVRLVKIEILAGDGRVHTRKVCLHRVQIFMPLRRRQVVEDAVLATWFQRRR